MKKTILLINFIICLSAQLMSQTIETGEAEANFTNIFGRSFSSKLNTVPLAKSPFKKLFYYSYKVVEKDSVTWQSYNDQNHLMDSIAHVSFMEAIDSMRNKGTICLLKNENTTYIPVFLFYKITDTGIFDDSVSISPMQLLFGWGFNEKNKPEAIYRISKPFILRLPKQENYFNKKQ